LDYDLLYYKLIFFYSKKGFLIPGLFNLDKGYIFPAGNKDGKLLQEDTNEKSGKS